MNLDCFWTPGKAIPGVAVAVGIMPQGNTHTGIIYREDDETSRLSMLHLAFHLNLRIDNIDNNMYCSETKSRFLCIVPRLEFEDAVAVAAHCRAIARFRPDILYGLSYLEDGRFEVTDSSVDLFFPENTGWLNCSTFVLTVFASAGSALVDPKGWPARPQEDSLWQAKLVGMVARHPKVTPEHVRRIRRDVGTARIRPEETAGAALEDELPAPFNQCEPNGQVILELMSRLPFSKAGEPVAITPYALPAL